MTTPKTNRLKILLFIYFFPFTVSLAVTPGNDYGENATGQPIKLTLPFGVSATEQALISSGSSLSLSVTRLRDDAKWTFSTDAGETVGLSRVAEAEITDFQPNDVVHFEFSESEPGAAINIQGGFRIVDRFHHRDMLHSDPEINDSIVLLYKTNSQFLGGGIDP